jgi:hypothetical protein
MFDKLFDFDHPFFRPLWLRVVVVGFCLAWTGFELVSGSPGWGMLFGAIGVYAGYRLFVTFAPRDKP